MPEFYDAEFGEIVVHKRRDSRSVRIRMGVNGRLVATAPVYTPLLFIRQVVNASRDELRKITQHPSAPTVYGDGQAIGKSHSLAVVATSMVTEPTTEISRQKLLVYLPPNTSLESQEVQQRIRTTVIAILRKEAKARLPGRLKHLAATYGFSYSKIRFSHASGRWGSCSSEGTISLNIALMKLPDELIDYVLIHELCHTRHMNHSDAFWREVERYDPHFRLHKRQIKRETPSV